MGRNVGSADRGIRAVLGLVIIGLGIYFGSWLGLVGLIPLVTSAIGWCPIYVPFGLSTCANRSTTAGGA